MDEVAAIRGIPRVQVELAWQLQKKPVTAPIVGATKPLGMFGTWVAMFMDWIVKSIIFIRRYLSKKWTKFDVI